MGIIIKNSRSTIGVDEPYHKVVSVKVWQIDRNFKVVAVFDSVYQAEKLTGIKHISECINGKPSRKTAGGYYWKKEEDILNEGND